MGREAFGCRGFGRGPTASQWSIPEAASRNTGAGFGDLGVSVRYHQRGRDVTRPLAAPRCLSGGRAGLAILTYMMGTGRMGRVRRQPRQSTHHPVGGEDGAETSLNLWNAATSGGSQAFDEYRAETLRRMEAEQEEFAAFVERLRFARDKAEFDLFMAERQSALSAPSGQSQNRPTG
ncbi:MAG TPA: DUF2852 domain-containing protein [Rhodopila sp.]|nr:DUF2852 domain-containing protein [Rhodopila sp.]